MAVQGNLALNGAAAEPKYDVAISFLARDVATAQAVADRLEDGLSVFFFPRNQEEVAGTDGLVSMREPFLDARVVVVLFRTPWSKTDWTRVEETAIKDRSLKRGWTSLMFVQIDKTSALPIWLPDTHIRFGFEDYGIDQLVGAIKLRVQESGGVIEPLDALGEAKRVKREAEYLADRDALMRNRQWIEDKVRARVRETMEEVVRLVEEANATFGFEIRGGSREMGCVLRSGFVSMAVGFRQPISNFVGDEAHDKCLLSVGEYSGTVFLPGETGYIMHKPKALKEHRFKVDVSQARDLVWVAVGRNERIAPSAMADRIVKLFLDLVSRANQGKVERPYL